MKQIIQNLQNGIIELEEVPIPNVKKGHVLIQTKYSLISSGTEKMLLNFGKSNYLGKAIQKPDRLKEVINKAKNEGLINTWEKVQNKLSEPIPLGYSNVGVVIAVGKDVNDIKVGQRVVSNGAHSEIVLVPQNLCINIPKNVSDIEASFTILGSIALQGIRLANPTLGENFVVSGLGIIGLLTSQILIAQGCNVIGIDIDKQKCDLARELGIFTLNLNECADPINSIIGETNVNGVDGVIVAASTKSNEPIELAAKISRQRGRIVLIGVTGLELNRDLFYKKELSFQVSCSYGPGRYDPKYEIEGLDYPFGFVRWTEKRNMNAIIELLSKKLISTDRLITHKYSLNQFKDAYDLLESRNYFLGILIKYPEQEKINSKKTILFYEDEKKGMHIIERSKNKPSINFIGCGNYARSILIPIFYKEKVELNTIYANNGLAPTQLAKKFKFRKASTDTQLCFTDNTPNTIVISTRHDTHAKFIIEALKNNKNVYVEKPICLNIEELKLIEKTYKKQLAQKNPPILMIGFNRRFAPLIKILKNQLDKIQGPKSIIYTCNAGFVDSNNWIHDKKIGGGRLIGEACHFVDLIRFLIGNKIVNIAKQDIKKGVLNNDSFNLQIDFEDGSIATINYVTFGPNSYPKERIEVYAKNVIFRLDNFIKLKAWGIKNFKNIRHMNQNKGQKSCVKSFLNAIQLGEDSPIPFNEIIEVQNYIFSVKN